MLFMVFIRRSSKTAGQKRVWSGGSGRLADGFIIRFPHPSSEKKRRSILFAKLTVEDCSLSLSVKSKSIGMAMYIRVKRNKTTYFLQCDATEKVLDIKQKLHTLIDQPVNDQRLILAATGEVLDDSKTLADQKVENDAVVALTLRKDDNEFEDVNIVRPNDFYQSRDTDTTGNW
ncbi:hypothetical protein L6452_03079 [Arctium lappa]|uniref:Uncharacterized protein n=1 Tax=Arctium lappa TaxID=4217 RepID=A0ACB9FLD1_ARCLA|nr:hypothetical protein L6452_03079 [Arctium lappa]